MPTVVFVDSSPSMKEIIKGNIENLCPFQWALPGLKIFFKNMHCSKFEYFALGTYNLQFEVISPFTRDYDEILLKSLEIRFDCEPNWTTLLEEIQVFIHSFWDHNVHCDIIFLTCSTNFLKMFISSKEFTNLNIIVCYFGPENVNLENIEMSECSCNVQLYLPKPPISLETVEKIFFSLLEKFYSEWNGQLVCGSFCSKIKLFPYPKPYNKITDFDTKTYMVENIIEVCGFIDLKDLGNPGTLSRHLVLPYSLPSLSLAMSELSSFPSDVKRNEDTELENDSQTPSFCVLLHGALKIEKMAAICTVGNDWYGILFSCSDSKKKANLMLSILEPGTDEIPWLGDLNKMTILTNKNDSFPKKNMEKKNTHNCVWIHKETLKNDLQKIVRLAKKIPEKTIQFYRELNRVRRLAIALGFLSLFDALSALLERECTLLPGTAHPACALQLTHAAGSLRDPLSRDYKYNILPMKTSF